MKNKLLYDAIGRFYRRTLIFGPTPGEAGPGQPEGPPSPGPGPARGSPAPDLRARRPGGRP